MPQRSGQVPVGVLRWPFARWWRVALLVVVLALLALRVAAPLLLARFVETQGASALGRVVEVGGVDLDLLAGRVHAWRVHAGPLVLDPAAARQAGPLAPGDVRLGAQRVSIDLSSSALLRGELHVEELAIDGPRVLRLRDAAGSLPPLFRAGASSPEPVDAEPTPPIQLDVLRITRARYFYYDASHPERLPLEVGIGELRLAGVAFAGQELVVERLDLDEPSVRVLGDFDVAALAADADPEAEPRPEDGAEDSEPLRVRVREVSLNGARLSVVAGEGEPQFETALELRASEVSFEPDARFPFELTLQVDPGELALAGELGLTPLRFDGSLEWSALPLARIASVARGALPVRVEKGASAGALDVSLGPGARGAPRLRLAGRAALADLALSSPEGLELGWRNLALAIDSFELDSSGAQAPSLSLASLDLEAPRVVYVRSAAQPAPDAPAPGGAADAPEPPPQIRIAQLSVSDGALDFENAALVPPQRTSLRELTLDGRDLRWPERSAAALHLEARGPQKSRVVAEASGGGEELDINVVLSRVGLAEFSPYIVGAAGYRVDKGRADLEARVRVRGDRTRVKSDLTLNKLAVTSVDAGLFEKRFGMSLDVALALLRDVSGNIRVPISFRIEREGSRFDLPAILIAALRQALVGALSTPLKGVGLLLGGGDEEGELAIAPLECAPGGTALLAPQELGALAALLNAHPELGLRLRGGFAETDAPGVAEQLLIARVESGAELPDVASGFLERRRVVSALEARGRGEAGTLEGEDRALLARWIAAVPIDAEQRRAFANRRAEAVRAALVTRHGIDAARLVLGEPLDAVAGVAVELAPAGQ